MASCGQRGRALWILLLGLCAVVAGAVYFAGYGSGARSRPDPQQGAISTDEGAQDFGPDRESVGTGGRPGDEALVAPHAELDERQRLGADVSGPGPSPGGAKRPGGETTDAAVRVAVAFRVPTEDGAGAAGFVHVSWSSDPEHAPARWRVTGDGCEGELPAGAYLAAFEDAAGRYGPLAAFDVREEAVEVQLGLPAPFAARLTVQDQRSGDALEGARVSFVRTDLATLGVESPERVVLSSPDGSILAEELTPGTWAVTGSMAEYSSVTSEVELPGKWADQLADSNALTIGTFKLVPLTLVTFQLVDLPSGAGATGFRIAHTHEGEPVPFDAGGQAVLELGRFYEPLYVKLWHPDGRMSVRYLDGGLPEGRGAHEISIGGGQVLEVDLQLGREVSDAIPAGSAAVQVSFRDGNGDAVLVVAETDGPGVFEFEGIGSLTATVSLTVVEEGLPVAWQAENVDLVPGERNACTLMVAERPLKLAFVDADGAPVKGFHAEVRHVPDTTTWIAGGACGDDGIVTIPRASAGRYSLRGAVEDYSIVALDLPLDLSVPGPTVEVALWPVTPTFVECQVDGKPRAGVAISIIGADDPTSYGDETTDDAGRTYPYGLVDRSRARARLESSELWAPERVMDLSPGRNLMAAFDTGFVEGRPEQLARFQSLAFGVTLEDWEARGQIVVSSPDARTFRARVPTGEYSLKTVAGDSLPFHVAAGETLKLP